jgi:phosphate acyltransferase
LTAIGSLPVVVDAMGGDKAPTEIVAGARQAVDELGIDVVLMGPPELVGDTRGLELISCTEVIGMDEDPAKGVRRKKDSSLVRAAELVRDGQACAMVSAGNTGATMGAALLRMGRLKGVHRPCIATPLPKPGRAPGVLVDAGANSECTPAMLVQFAQMAAAFSTARFGIAEPTVGLLSIGEEPSKGTALVKETHALLAEAGSGVSFFGNVEGRDLLDAPVDVVVTDGFTGNVALKTLEGSLRFIMDRIVSVFGTDEETKAAAKVLLPHLAPLITELDPETFGGAMLLGLDGVCIISHGSSSALAMKNAIKVGHDLATAGITEALSSAVHVD